VKELHYIWDPKPLPKPAIQKREDFLETALEEEVPAVIPGKGRVASEGYIGVREGKFLGET